MIRIYPADNLLILNYTSNDNPYLAKEKLVNDGSFMLRKTFYFQIKDLLDDSLKAQIENAYENQRDLDGQEDEDPFGEEGVSFVLGRKIADYYRIEHGMITRDHPVSLHESLKMDVKLFVSHRNISVFAKLEKFIKDHIYIGGSANNAIPEAVMWGLINKFPNTYQKDLYEGSVITNIIRDYVDNVPDYIAKYEKYLNKRRAVKPSDLGPILKDQEIHKFQLIRDKLETMLKEEISYHETQWQEEILTIISLIYPKYVYAFKNVQLKRKDQTDLFVDILLIDSAGYADIIEIKKPFESAIVTQATYRDNHIPYRELTGTIMQIEKYIYHLNRWGADGEKHLTQRLKGLPDGFEVKLTNPGGLVIMGRDNNLIYDQKKDFEVVKRKYKNIMDILTYDELLRRLTFMIELWKQKPSSACF